MQMGCVRATLVVIACCLFCDTGYTATIDFETIPSGTVYGQDVGHTPGQVVLDWENHDGIDMSVELFHLDDFEGFFSAQIDGMHSSMFDTHSLSLLNISVLFDFSHVGFAVDTVTFEFGDPGGTSNIVINNETLHILDPITDLPFEVAAGVTATIDNGLVTITGINTSIHSLLIGGQELVIDNIVAVPDPASGLLLLVGGAMLIRRKRQHKIQ